LLAKKIMLSCVNTCQWNIKKYNKKFAINTIENIVGLTTKINHFVLSGIARKLHLAD